MSFPRHVFQMEEGSRAQVLESYFFVNAGLSPTGTRHFSDGHSTYLLGAGCALDFHQMQGWVNPKKGPEKQAPITRLRRNPNTKS